MSSRRPLIARRERSKEDRRRVTIHAGKERLHEVDALYGSQGDRMAKLLARYSAEEFDVILHFLEQTTAALGAEMQALKKPASEKDPRVSWIWLTATVSSHTNRSARTFVSTSTRCRLRSPFMTRLDSWLQAERTSQAFASGKGRTFRSGAKITPRHTVSGPAWKPGSACIPEFVTAE